MSCAVGCFQDALISGLALSVIAFVADSCYRALALAATNVQMAQIVLQSLARVTSSALSCINGSLILAISHFYVA
jgi:chromate transport protein ChrA